MIERNDNDCFSAIALSGGGAKKLNPRMSQDQQHSQLERTSKHANYVNRSMTFQPNFSPA